MVTIDSYPEGDTTDPGTAATARVSELNAVHAARPGVPVVIGEMGYSNNMPVTDAQQQAVLQAEFSAIEGLSYVAGANYWVGPGTDQSGGYTHIFAGQRGSWTLRPAASNLEAFFQYEESEDAGPPPTPTPTPSPPLVTSSVSASTHGYWLVGSDGGIFTFGSAQFHGSTGSLHLQRPVVGIVQTVNRSGYWLDASDGGIFAFNTGFFGSIPGLGLNPAGSDLPNSLNAPIVGMVPSVTGQGYFMVASDGGVFAFGDAKFAGSCPGIGGCSGAAVAVMPDATGNGYWVVTETGNVYTFGDAPYFGAPGQQSSAITSAVATPSGRGYYILDGDGQVFAYGDANGRGGTPAGSTGGLNPATAIFDTGDGGGYWIATALGKVFQLGDAPDEGDMSATHLNGSIIAASGW